LNAVEIVVAMTIYLGSSLRTVGLFDLNRRTRHALGLNLNCKSPMQKYMQ